MADPLCPYFRRCGGCLYQDLDYSEQVRQKADELRLATRCSFLETFTGQPYFYRSRMDFIFHPGGLGLRERGRWWRLVDIERCVIATEPLNILLQEVRSFFQPVDAFDVRLKKGTFRFAVIRTPPGDSSVSIVLNKESPALPAALELIQEWAKKTTARNVLVTFVPPNRDVSVSDDFKVVKGGIYLEEEVLGQKFRYPIQGFFQNNHHMMEKLHLYCRSILERHGGSRTHLLDLYAGVGTFGLLNADLFGKVYLLENYPPAIEAAKDNLTRFNLKNVSPILEEAKNIRWLSFPSPLVVIADPPRSGLHPHVLKYIKAVKPKVVLYISCNIRQLKQDLAALAEYRVKHAALFDFFPHTPHLEAVVELLLKEKN